MAVDQRVEQKALESAGIDRARQPHKGAAAAEMFSQQRAKLGNERFMRELAEGRTRPLSDARIRETAQRASDNTTEQLNIASQFDQYTRLAEVGGFDSLPNTEQQKYRTEILSSLGPNFGDILTGPPALSPTEQNTLAETILKDKLYATELNARVHEIARRRFDPAPKDINRVMAQLTASDPTTYPDGSDTARQAAYAQLRTEFQSNMQADIDGAASYAAQQVIKSNIEAAHVVVNDKATELDNRTKELSTEAGKRSGDGIAEQLRRRWDAPRAFDRASSRLGAAARGVVGMNARPEGVGIGDYDSFAQHGLTDGFLRRCGVNATDIATIQANPELRKEYEKTIGQDLLLRKLASGTFNDEDRRRLEHAPWMGNTPQERVESIRQMYETRQEFKNLANAARAGGMLDSNFWDNARDALARGGLPGGIAGLLAILLGLPLASISLVMAPAGAAIGVAGGAYFRRMRQMAREQRTFDAAA